MMTRFKKILRLIVLLIGGVCLAQEVPPIQVFTQQDYKAEDQNWDISQDVNGVIYVANNQGLLRYNGARWDVFPSLNQSIIRSVKVIGNNIYTGCYMDFGFWQENQFGDLVYTSLVQKGGITLKEDEQFWDIIEIEDYILFQSLDRIYIYNVVNETFKVINSQSRINRIFKVGKHIYFQKNGVGICEIKNGEESLVIPYNLYQDNDIINIYSNDDNTLLLFTKEDGIYKYDEGNVTLWKTTTNALLEDLSIYSSIQLKDGSYLLGTISQGIIQISKNGEKVLSVDQSAGLSNNTILTMYEGVFGNIWLGLDNGINCINITSPFTVYKDKQGIIGTVYTSYKKGAYLYLGSNQGLFFRQNNSQQDFKLVEGTKGQVWYLNEIQGDLFCGHDKGTFIIKNGTANYIEGDIGTWLIKETDNPNVLIQGNYDGLSILEKVNTQWVFRNRIEGFDISSRYLDFVNKTDLLISHEYKGVYKVKLDTNYQRVVDIKKLKIKEGAKSSIVDYQNTTLYRNKYGVYKYNSAIQSFENDSTISQLVKDDDYLSGKLIVEKNSNKLWLFSQDNITYVEPGTLSQKPNITTIAISQELRNSKVGYENILSLSNNRYLIGTTDGYIIINLDKLENKSKTIAIDHITTNSKDLGKSRLSLEKASSLENKNNSIYFRYAVTDYNTFLTKTYKYRLLGFYDNWSPWTQKTQTDFENLPYGDYTFEVMAKTGDIVSENTASYSFTVEKPWYLKPLAIIAYVVLGILFLLLIQFLNNRYYKIQKQKLLEKKQREMELKQLENQRQLVQFKNQNLQLDIENKNRELGTATMNLVKRNELLNNIKEALTESKSLNDVKSVIKLINNNLNSTNDWKLFEEAFNNVDKDFMKRIKTIHPTITPNDLRLCAYLRLNLSSKEIAPLLNISHKSVEVKRYRLRKKMGLDHEQSLTDYILDL